MAYNFKNGIKSHLKLETYADFSKLSIRSICFEEYSCLLKDPVMEDRILKVLKSEALSSRTVDKVRHLVKDEMGPVDNLQLSGLDQSCKESAEIDVLL